MKTFISAARLIDGSGAAPVDNPLLEIEGGRILRVHDAAAGRPDVGAGDIRDFPGATILPGLIDTHVHLNLPGTGLTLEEAMREGEGVMLATSMGSAATALGAGITTVRDLGAFGTTSFSARRAIELGTAKGAKIMACGQPITITGGHCWYMGGEADGVDGVRRKVREMCKNGADFIKVMGSGGGTLGTISYRPCFSLEEMKALADEAHRNDRRITVHCLCAEAIDYAIEAGVDQIEHANFLIDPKGNQKFDPAVAERLAKSGIPVTTTLVVSLAARDAALAKDDPSPAHKAWIEKWVSQAEVNLAHFSRLRETGVTFVAGTDAGWRSTAFDTLPVEMELMVKGGCTALEAIAAATGIAADAIGLADRGRLIPGQAADVLVVDGDPTTDLDALRDPLLILQDGQARAITGRAGLSATAGARA